MTAPVATMNTGLITGVGLSAPAACAAIRAGVTNLSETRFIDSTGEWILALKVPLEQPWCGPAKLVKMTTKPIRDRLGDLQDLAWSRVSLLLCVAERERLGGLEELDGELRGESQSEVGAEVAQQCLVISSGRVGVATTLLQTLKPNLILAMILKARAVYPVLRAFGAPAA